MKQPYTINGYTVKAESCIDGVLINPILPTGFMVNEHDKRTPDELAFWWRRPFIIVDNGAIEPATWLDEKTRREAEHYIRMHFASKYPKGVRYLLHVLDGAEPCEPTTRGIFKTMEDALTSAKAWLEADGY